MENHTAKKLGRRGSKHQTRIFRRKDSFLRFPLHRVALCLKSIKPVLAPQKESIFSRSCRLWLLSWRRARVFARSCSLFSKYLPISWKQRKEQSHAQCHVTHRIRIFDKISEHVKVAKSVDIAVPELAVTIIESGNFLETMKNFQ